MEIKNNRNLLKAIKNFNLQDIAPNIRYLKEIKKVIYDQKWFEKADKETELYYMYRGIKQKEDFRYDITIIPPRMLGQEYVRTKGHHHSNGYGEIYIVLQGEGIYYTQKENPKDRKIVEKVEVTKGKEGDVIIIPPYFSHITINASSKILITANWVSEKCQSIYQDLEKTGGPCYFYTQKGWLKNGNYSRIPKIEFKKPIKSLPSNLGAYLEPEKRDK